MPLVVPESLANVCKVALSYAPAALPGPYVPVYQHALMYAQSVRNGDVTAEQVRAAKAWYVRNAGEPKSKALRSKWNAIRSLYGGVDGELWASTVVRELDAPVRVRVASVTPEAVHVDKSLDALAVAEHAAVKWALVEQRAAHTGVCIVLPVLARVAARIALECDGALPPDELHLTMVMLGDKARVFLDEYDANTLRDTLREWALSMPCVLGEVSGIGRFIAQGDSKDPCYYSVDAQLLNEHYTSLCTVLDAGMWSRERNHGFTPHITAAYVAKGEPTPFKPTSVAATTPIMFDHIALWIGDEHHEFPFKPVMEPSEMRPLRLSPQPILNLTVETTEQKQAHKEREATAKAMGTISAASNVLAAPVAVSVIQVAKIGAFNGHNAGPFEFTPSVFDTIIANFNATQNAAIPIDYEHASESMNTSVMQDGAPAIGWLKSLENRGAEGLWGTVEWMDARAVEYIRAGRYKFFSPAVMFGATDPITGADIGAMLVSGGLTNRPFLDGMAQVTASARDAEVDAKLTELRAQVAALKITPAQESKIEALHKKLDAMIAQLLADATVEVHAPLASTEVGEVLNPVQPDPMVEMNELIDALVAAPLSDVAARNALAATLRARFGAAPLNLTDAQHAALPKLSTDNATPSIAASANTASESRGPSTEVTHPARQEGTAMGFKEDIAKSMGMDVACSEADLVSAVTSKMSKLAEMEVTAIERMRADAVSEVEVLAAAGRITNDDATVQAAVTLRMSQPKLFSALYPKQAPAQDGARIGADARAKLATPMSRPSTADAGGTGGKSSNALAHEQALELMRTQPNVYSSYTRALKAAASMVG